MPLPLVREIPYLDPARAFRPFAGEPYAMFLDSALADDRLGRYSFIAAAPFQTLTSKGDTVIVKVCNRTDGPCSQTETVEVCNRTISGDPFEVLRRELARFPLNHRDGFPRFQTGVAGYFAYDLCHHLEELPTPGGPDDMGFPDLALGFYDVVIAFDQVARKAWIMSSGYPAGEGDARTARARSRLVETLTLLSDREGLLTERPPAIPPSDGERLPTEHLLSDREGLLTERPPAIPPSDGERLPTVHLPSDREGLLTERPRILSNFSSRTAYEKAVQKVIDYIYAGDIFQANLSQRFRAELSPQDTPFDLYQRLRDINPAPFAAYLNLGETVIASASPERFILLQGDHVETRPIKGTRPRGETPEADHALADELLASDKDKAENVMIVDLMRNDISRVCRDHTVNTPEICTLESYATVHHLVSTVVGQLREGTNAIDLLKATIPGGSITGAPKIRAMEVIAELEPTWRGPYCGNVGYISFTGDMDTSIVIRTYALQGNTVTFQAGGGIVADSDPAAEYEETIDKARALMDALGGG